MNKLISAIVGLLIVCCGNGIAQAVSQESTVNLKVQCDSTKRVELVRVLRHGELFTGSGDEITIENRDKETFVQFEAGPVSDEKAHLSLRFLVNNAEVKYLLPIGMGASVKPIGGSVKLAWPSTWSSAFVVLEVRKGCFVAAWSDDGAAPFKEISLGEKEFSIRILRSQTNTTKSRWYLRAFSDWREAADVFRKDVLVVNNAEIQDRAKGIDRVVVQRLGKSEPKLEARLHELSSQHATNRTLLYWPLWRESGESDFDENYPEHNPKPFIKEGIKTAHKLGFKVMLHFNTDFVGMNSQYKDKLWGERLLSWKDGKCTEPIYYQHSKYTGRHAFKVDRGSQLWKDLMLSIIEEQYRELKFDAIHMDVSVSIPLACNVGGIAGTREFFKELRTRFPDLIISGEENSEITYGLIDIFQALPAHISGWPIQLRGKAEDHSIGMYLYSPARVYGHLHGGEVDRDGKFFSEFGDTLLKQGRNDLYDSLIPTYWEP